MCSGTQARGAENFVCTGSRYVRLLDEVFYQSKLTLVVPNHFLYNFSGGCVKVASWME